MRTDTPASRCLGRKRPAHRLRRVLILLLLQAPTCLFGGGPFGIDQEWSYRDSGIWKREYQEALQYGLIAVEVCGGLWYGAGTLLGRTFWQAIDASAASGILSRIMKNELSRVRPVDSGPGGDPNLWFKGSRNESFPSAEVSEVSSIITPFILRYGRVNPAVYVLALLPAYDGIARIKVQAHWQSDVIAGFALGTTLGWLAFRNRGKPWLLRIMPRSVHLGLANNFRRPRRLL
jgi:membrane-associated phospholipid phosphatase